MSGWDAENVGSYFKEKSSKRGDPTMRRMREVIADVLEFAMHCSETYRVHHDLAEHEEDAIRDMHDRLRDMEKETDEEPEE